MPVPSALTLGPQTSFLLLLKRLRIIDLLILSIWMVVGRKAGEYGRSNHCPACLLTARSEINREKVREEQLVDVLGLF